MERHARRTDGQRLAIAFPVRFVVEGKRGGGVVTDVSPGGIRLRTDLPLDAGDALAIDLTTPEGDTINLTGDVRWRFESPPMVRLRYPVEVGVSIHEPPRSFIELVERQGRAADFRDNPRFPERVHAELVGPGIWEATYTLNLSRRGLFVRTDREVAPGQLVEVRMDLPGRPGKVTARCEVVYQVSVEQASDVGVEAGLGVRIVTMTATDREVFNLHVKGLEDRGA